MPSPAANAHRDTRPTFRAALTRLASALEPPRAAGAGA
jgi:hypothetical protein